MKQFIRNWLTANRSNLICFAGVAAFYLFLFAVGITCPIKYLIGISCAGCGMTRAWVHALTFRFDGAFHYNPAFWVVPIIAVFLWLQKKYPIISRIGLALCLGIMLIVYCIRMADPIDTVVVFAPKDGAIYRFCHTVISQIGTWLGL